jgi:streptogramin lyase
MINGQPGGLFAILCLIFRQSNRSLRLGTMKGYGFFSPFCSDVTIFTEFHTIGPERCPKDIDMTRHSCLLLALLLPSVLLTGCGAGPLAVPSAEPGAAIKGTVHGGQQPIAGSHIYLLAANTTGYGGSGIAASAANASVSLLQVANTGLSDPLGAYVLSDAGGNFSISGDYSCTPGQQVYLYAKGGNPGAGVNANVGMMAILGSCPTAGNFAAATPYVLVNEVSTVAAAYAMAGFASDATHVSSSGTALAQTGIANAFANASNLETLATGIALATTPAGNGVAPQTTVNTLANILATCVNTADVYNGSTYVSPSGGCSTLLGTATLDGTPTGAQPTDTASAAINIAHFPGSNISTLFALPSPTAPFTPALPTATTPNDFVLTIGFNGGGLLEPVGVAIDANGDAWLADSLFARITELSPTGAPLSPTTGFTGGGLGVSQNSRPIAVDLFGNVWVPGAIGTMGTLIEFTSAGAPYANSPYSGGGFFGGSNTVLAIDGTGNVWVSNSATGTLSKFSNAGIASANSPTSAVANAIFDLAIDASGDIWASLAPFGNSNTGLGLLAEFSSTGSLVSSASGYTASIGNEAQAVAIDNSGAVWFLAANQNVSPNPIYLEKSDSSGNQLSPNGGYTGGGLANTSTLVVDGAGNLWSASFSGGALAEFSNSGVALSPSTGYLGTSTVARNYSIAVDGSGDIWETSSGSANAAYNRVWEAIGIAAPVVTPLAANLAAPYNKAASKP